MSEEDPCKEQRDREEKLRKEKEELDVLFKDTFIESSNGEDLSKRAIYLTDERAKKLKRWEEVKREHKEAWDQLVECEKISRGILS
jgi:hypothetical protein